MRWFADLSPASKIVVLFASLNVALVLVFTLMAPPFRTPGAPPPFLDPVAALGRIAVAVAVVLAILRVTLLVRPSWRSMGLSALALGGATALLALEYTPVLALAYLPLALRVRWSLPRTVLACALLLAALLPVSFFVRGMGWTGLGERTVGQSLLFAVVLGALGAYLLLTFELALREARARQELMAQARELARLRDLAAASAGEAERARIARELHDTLGHHLTAQRFDLLVLLEDPQDRTARAALERAAARNADAIADLRRAVDALRAEDGGAWATDVGAALAGLVRALAPAAPVELRVEDVSAALSPEGRRAVYRAAQEAVTNAAKHAPHAPVVLSLRAGAGGVTFEADNPAPRPPGAEGHGLRGLRERARLLGGEAGLEYTGGRVRLWMTLPAAGTP